MVAVSSQTNKSKDELGSTSHIATASGAGLGVSFTAGGSKRSGSLGKPGSESGNRAALIESYQYDVYGKPRVYDSGGTYQQNAIPVAQDLFTGQRWRSELGLYDDRNRFMSPDLGRFLQPDPIGFKGDASNLYRYCGNDWANRTDPMGLTDVYISPEVLGLIRDASVNSISESAKRNDGNGRGQLVEHKVDPKGNDKPHLQNKFYPSQNVDKPREDFQKEHKGSAHHYVMQEGPYKADSGNKIDGIGHSHQDVTGKGEPKFSEDDKNTARGDQKVAGVPLGRIDESDQTKLHVLVPQIERTEPKEKTFDAKTLEPIQDDDRKQLPNRDPKNSSLTNEKRR